ncbi:MAG TPA: hypothetical protein PLC79_03460 [Phycisphaerae bacterium]|nr:hypothetical protein [Phycisphaerae bacterium]
MPARYVLVCLSSVGLIGCNLSQGGGPGFAAASRAATATAPAVRFTQEQIPRGQAGPAAILEPSQGRPVILRPGDRFYFLMRLGDSFDAEMYVSLVHSEVGEVYFPLSAVGELKVQPQRHASMVLQVPAEAPEGLYDLRVRGAGRTLTARHSVKVVREFRTRFRFVHLSDMWIGDPTAPDFDARLPEEINLLAPEFIVATGNYILPQAGDDGRTPWPRVLAYFARFQAPVYLLCGEQDDEAGFVPIVGASPIGSFDYGPYHGVLLRHTPARPIDAAQADFVRRDLAERRDRVFNFLAMNDDDPAVVDQLAAGESPAAFLRGHRVAMLLAGGTGDWDGREYASALARLPGLHYIRTHAASTCRRGRATGVSHYRVIEVDGANVAYAYPADPACGSVQPSIPVGGLGVTIRTDGGDPPAQVTAVIRNGLNQPFADCRVRLTVAKRGEGRPKVAGGRLVQALDGRTRWLCEISVDLPDCGGVRVAACADREPPAPLPVVVEFAGDAELRFATARTRTGLTYLESNDRLVVRLRNPSRQPLTLRPTIRLAGQVLTVTAPGRPPWPVVVGAGQTVELPMRLLLPEATEGPHYVQVSFQEDPLERLYLHPVTVRKVPPPATRPAR